MTLEIRPRADLSSLLSWRAACAVVEIGRDERSDAPAVAV